MSQIVRGLSYDLTVHQYEEQWNNAAGIYIFAGLNQQGQWIPCYIGQCDMAQSLGAADVHAMVVLLASDRDRVERELIQHYQPRLNFQLR